MRCKVGDLAFVVSSKFSENIGCVVRVINSSEYAQFDWRVESCGKNLKSQTSTGVIVFGELVLCRDDQLRPIRGEPDKTDITEREKEFTNA